MQEFYLLAETMLNSLVQQLNQNPCQLSIYAGIFQCLTGLRYLKLGQQLHAHMAVRGLTPDAFVSAKMVAMYASSGDIDSAIHVFNSTVNPSSLSFNAIIRAFTLYGETHRTIETFYQMHSLGLRGDYFTYPFVLKSCSNLSYVSFGKCIHGLSLKSGLEFDLYVGASLVDFYAKFGELVDARKLFDQMPHRSLSSCNALIAGYMKEGCANLAEDLFRQIGDRNVISWTAMISGYAQNGLAEKALGLFKDMLKVTADVEPNWVTIISVLPACAHSSALKCGRQIHSYAKQTGLEYNTSVQTALMAMYAKCGSLVDTRLCFERILPDEINLVAWNTLITAYASHGHGKQAVSAFEEMIRAGFQPDEISFTGLLSGCSHAGLVDAGLQYFDSMRIVYLLETRYEHYACVVDLLGRAGRLVEAYNFTTQMPMEAGPSVWGALLSASCSHRNLEIAELAAKKLFLMEPGNSGNYIMLSNMYAEAGMWEEANKLRTLLKSDGVKKTPGYSWGEVNGNAHVFFGGDASHFWSKEMHLLPE